MNFDADESNIIDATTNGDENIDDIRIRENIEPNVDAYIQYIVRERRYDMGCNSRPFDLMRYGVQDFHEENHQDDESSDDSDVMHDLVDIVDSTDGVGNDDEVDVMPDLVDIVDSTDGVGNDDDELDNSDVNSDDVGTDQVNVDNSDDVIPDHVDIVDNNDDVGNDDDEVDSSDVKSDDVGTDPDNVENSDINDESVSHSNDVDPDQINVDN